MKSKYSLYLIGSEYSGQGICGLYIKNEAVIVFNHNSFNKIFMSRSLMSMLILLICK